LLTQTGLLFLRLCYLSTRSLRVRGTLRFGGLFRL